MAGYSNMWTTTTATTASEKASIIGSYNSLKDPHLRTHFRKPQIRRHLLKANIINKDNKIVEEISSTKHQQNVERKHRRELYQMLNELFQEQKQKQQIHGGQHNDSKDSAISMADSLCNDPKTNIQQEQHLQPSRIPVPKTKTKQTINSEEFINHARSMFVQNGFKSSRYKSHSQSFQNASTAAVSAATSGDQQRVLLLQKLDRMIKTIKEHNELIQDSVRPRKMVKSNLRPCKSQLDLSMLDSMENDESISKSSLSTPQLYDRQISMSKRPKSSYGRTRMKRCFTKEYLPSSKTSDQIKPATSKTNLKKCVSLANIRTSFDNDDDDDIQTLDGESFDDDSDQPKNDPNEYRSFIFTKNYYNQNKKLPTTKQVIILDNNSHEKKYYQMDRRFEKSSASGRNRQSNVQMTLRYNGLNEATNLGAKRNVKVYQQITIGGNSILIYDGFIKPGETFTIDIRPHISNSFAINILVNGIRDLRLNTCCERKHRPGTRLSHFTIVDIIGGRPCFNCINWQLNNNNSSMDLYNSSIYDDDEYEPYIHEQDILERHHRPLYHEKCNHLIDLQYSNDSPQSSASPTINNNEDQTFSKDDEYHKEHLTNDLQKQVNNANQDHQPNQIKLEKTTTKTKCKTPSPKQASPLKPQTITSPLKLGKSSSYLVHNNKPSSTKTIETMIAFENVQKTDHLVDGQQQLNGNIEQLDQVNDFRKNRDLDSNSKTNKLNNNKMTANNEDVCLKDNEIENNTKLSPTHGQKDDDHEDDRNSVGPIIFKHITNDGSEPRSSIKIIEYDNNENENHFKIDDEIVPIFEDLIFEETMPPPLMMNGLMSSDESIDSELKNN